MPAHRFPSEQRSQARSSSGSTSIREGEGRLSAACFASSHKWRRNGVGNSAGKGHACTFAAWAAASPLRQWPWRHAPASAPAPRATAQAARRARPRRWREWRWRSMGRPRAAASGAGGGKRGRGESRATAALLSKLRRGGLTCIFNFGIYVTRAVGEDRLGSGSPRDLGSWQSESKPEVKL